MRYNYKDRRKITNMKDKLKNVVIGVVAGIALLGIVGCKNLDPAGRYGKLGAAGQWIYTFDAIVDQSYGLVDAAEKWELQNHAFLKTNAPNVVVVMEDIRVKAPRFFATYSTASVLYKTVQSVATSNAVVVAYSNITNATTVASTQVMSVNLK